MEITRELLLVRRDEIKERYDQLVADMNAHAGALQDVEHWLEVIGTGESSDSPEPHPQSVDGEVE